MKDPNESKNSWFWDNRKYSFIGDSFFISRHVLWAIRVFALILHAFFIIYHRIIQRKRYDDLEYLTPWGLLLSFIFYLTAVIEQGHIIFSGKPLNYKSKRLLAYISHITYEVAFSVQLTIVILYWGFVYPKETQKWKGDWMDHINACFENGGTLILLYVDQAFNLILFRVKHFLVVLAFYGAYFIANISVSLSRGIPVYSQLTWKNLRSYLLVVLIIVAAALNFATGYCISKRKVARRENPKLLEDALINDTLSVSSLSSDDEFPIPRDSP